MPVPCHIHQLIKLYKNKLRRIDMQRSLGILKGKEGLNPKPRRTSWNVLKLKPCTTQLGISQSKGPLLLTKPCLGLRIGFRV